MPVYYTNPENSQTFEFIPAPLVEVKKTYVTDNTGAILYPKYSFTLTGVITSLDDANHTMDYMVGQQKAIEAALNKQGGRLEIVPPDGGANTIEAFVMLEDLSFSKDLWVQRCDYTITFSAIGLVDDTEISDLGLASKSESWSVNEEPSKIYSITHTLNAVGLLLPSGNGSWNNPLQNARTWCNSKKYSVDGNGNIDPSVDIGLGIGSPNFSFININVASGVSKYYNYSAVENVGNTENSWNLVEKFIYIPSNTLSMAREEWSCSEQVNATDQSNAIININGTVFGLASDDFDTTTKLANAITSWNSSVSSNIFTRISGYFGTPGSLNPIPQTKQVTYNHLDGSVQYNYSYKRSNTTLISGAIEESVSINDIGPTDVFASIAIPGRSNGPIMQYMNTQNAPQRTITISALIPFSGSITTSSLRDRYLSKPNADEIVNAFKPSSEYFYITNNTEDWNPLTGQFSKSTTWIIKLLTTSWPSGTPSGIHNTD